VNKVVKQCGLYVIERDGNCVGCPFKFEKCNSSCHAFELDKHGNEGYLSIKCFPHVINYKVEVE
jgi:hypothetical protein